MGACLIASLPCEVGEAAGGAERCGLARKSRYVRLRSAPASSTPAEPDTENRIDFSVLPDLTDQDLKDLGVVLGDRRKMLRAIAKLDSTREAVTLMPKPASAPSVAAVQPVPVAEESSGRHHVTVMLCDLVDSTHLAAKLDPEEWRERVDAYLDAASAAVTEMGGKVAKKLVYGLLALFGYPAAQENDSERAVRAAFATQRALTELNRINVGRSPLAAGIAIDSGTGGDRCGRPNFRRGIEHRCAGTGTGGAGRGGGHGASTTASRRFVRR